jgi:acyl-CoA synthetase (AMP-forming)/AMP-acid ligase II
VEWLEQGPPVPFFVMYGATEASARLTYLPPADLRRKLGSIGRPIPGVALAVVSEDGRPVPCGVVGELVASGENIAQGYWNAPDETAERFDSGSYRTGDLGYMDGDGYFFLVGRRSDMIKVGGRRVGTKAIEDVLYAHPDVHEAAVVGAPDAILGEVPVAVVAVHEDAVENGDALVAFCRGRLAGHEVPGRVIFQRELPKLPGAGKVDRVAVRALVAGNICASGRTFNPLRR